MPQGVEVRVLFWAPYSYFTPSNTVLKSDKRPGFPGFFVVWCLPASAWGARAQNDPTGGLRGALITPKPTHRAAVTERPAFERLIRAIWFYEGTIETQIALKLLALFFSRPGELRLSEWSECDLAKGVWTIPASRTKMRREHKKPLAHLTIELLEELRGHSGNRRLAFPSLRSAERPISEKTRSMPPCGVSATPKMKRPAMVSALAPPAC